MIPVHAIHHDSRYYYDPELFNPDRFSPEEINKRPHFTFLPFGIFLMTFSCLKFWWNFIKQETVPVTALECVLAWFNQKWALRRWSRTSSSSITKIRATRWWWTRPTLLWHRSARWTYWQKEFKNKSNILEFFLYIFKVKVTIWVFTKVLSSVLRNLFTTLLKQFIFSLKTTPWLEQIVQN